MMQRRTVLGGAGALAGTLATFGAPRPARARRTLTMVTDWPDGPGPLASARRLARTIEDASDGRIRIAVSVAGAVVKPFETFDAVGAGVADLFHSHIGYFDGKSPALHFFSGVPFGLTATELFAWVSEMGGQSLFDRLGARHGIKPLLASSTGIQMGGWFRKPIEGPGDFAGLRYRMAEPGAEVLRRLGATVVTVPGRDIVTALKSGAIDGCEWLGPWLDTEMGLHRAATYYYTPGWQEPGTALALGVNRGLWDELPAADRQLIEAAAAGEYARSLAEFNANNARALADLRAKGWPSGASTPSRLLGCAP